MGSSIVFLLLLQIILIALNAIFASAEIAVLSLNETKLEKMAEQGNAKAKRLFHLTREPEKFLATIQVAITLSGFLGSAFAADNFAGPLVNWLVSLGVSIPQDTLNTIAVIVITLILSYFTLIFGELVPKRIAMKKSEQLAMLISGLVSGISVAFKPIVWFLSISTNFVLRLCGIDPTETEEEISEADIRMMVDAGSEKGTIDHQEKEFIQNVFEFNDTVVGDIATHRTDAIFLRTEDTDDEWAQIIHDTRHTYYPVCTDSPDKIIGVLNAKDYYRLTDRSRECVLSGAVHPAYFVPDTIKADVLFRNLKKQHHSFAIALDEYGGMSGIITMNDLIEELVGDFDDGTPAEIAAEPHIEQLDDNTWRIIGNVDLADIEEALGVDIGQEDVDTFSGLIFNSLGVIPSDGDQQIQLTFQQLSVQILRIEEHQIALAQVSLLPTEETPNAEHVK